MQKVTHHGCVRDNVVYFVHVVLPPCPMAAATATVASIHDARQCVRYRNPKILDEKINKKWAKTNKQMTLPHGPGGRNFANKRLWVSCVNADPLCRTAFSHISYCFCCAKFSWWFHVWDFWGNSNHYFSHYLSTNDECWKAPWHGTTVPCVTCTYVCMHCMCTGNLIRLPRRTAPLRIAPIGSTRFHSLIQQSVSLSSLRQYIVCNKSYLSFTTRTHTHTSSRSRALVSDGSAQTQTYGARERRRPVNIVIINTNKYNNNQEATRDWIIFWKGVLGTTVCHVSRLDVRQRIHFGSAFESNGQPTRLSISISENDNWKSNYFSTNCDWRALYGWR